MRDSGGRRPGPLRREGGLAARLGGRAGVQDRRGCGGGRTDLGRLPGLPTKILPMGLQQQTFLPSCSGGQV